MKSIYHIYRLIISLLLFQTVSLKLYIPGLPQKRYIQRGDINLGVVLSIYHYSASEPCGDSLRGRIIMQYLEAIVYAIQRVNNDSNILPNITLGFVILDDCLKESTTAVQVISFVPNVGDNVCNGTHVTNDIIESYDVVGVIGSLKSSSSVAAATILGPAHIPQISFSSTSDELSNKLLYPYFLRVVPSDEIQTAAMVALIQYYGWNYISVVYSAGSYGELGYRNLKRHAGEIGICIASAQKVDIEEMDDRYDDVVKILVEHIKARVVVIFGGPDHARNLFAAVKRLNQERQFIWIGSDGWGSRIANIGDLWEVALGAFTFDFYSKNNPEFERWFTAKRPLIEKNPWFKEFWENHFKCSFSSTPPTCNDTDVLSGDNGFKPEATVTTGMDAVYTFANALDRLVKDRCLNTSVSNIRRCIEGSELLEYLKTTGFETDNGYISFDKNGNLLGKHIIEQLVKDSSYRKMIIGVYDSKAMAITFSNNATWRYLKWTEAYVATPEIVCSRPCNAGEFRIPKRLSCCWSCRSCRPNEIIISNGTDCASCETFYWPDEVSNFTTCSRIPAKYIMWSDLIGAFLLSASIVGIFGTVFVLWFYVNNNSARCIKASSRELSYLMLAGIFLGYLTAAGLMMPPTDMSCMVNMFLFSLCCCWVYAPLVTRTVRIYRIFETGKTSNQRPPFISSKAQFLSASCLIAVQVFISTYVVIFHRPNARYVMPVVTKRYVELSCHLDLVGWLSFLVYNIMLIVSCSFFAFKTRKLPDNFNESRFITMCVYTTLIIWMAFIPAYFTAGREFLKPVLLSVALLLNDTVAILFLYLPKMYATWYVTQKSIRGHNPGSTHFSFNSAVAAASADTRCISLEETTEQQSKKLFVISTTVKKE